MAVVIKKLTLKNKTRVRSQRIYFKSIKRRDYPSNKSPYISERLEDEVLKEMLCDVLPQVDDELWLHLLHPSLHYVGNVSKISTELTARNHSYFLETLNFDGFRSTDLKKPKAYSIGLVAYE